MVVCKLGYGGEGRPTAEVVEPRRSREALPSSSAREMLGRTVRRSYSVGPAADLLSALHARITQLYRSQGDSASSSASLASQELRWLTDDARARHTAGTVPSWEGELERMTVELVEMKKPLAYILGTSSLPPPSTALTPGS